MIGSAGRAPGSWNGLRRAVARRWHASGGSWLPDTGDGEWPPIGLGTRRAALIDTTHAGQYARQAPANDEAVASLLRFNLRPA
jgi:hypothetical protein